MAGVSIHALTVSDNPNKFVIAVTRARVDSPSFLVVITSCCALHASPGRETLAENSQQTQCHRAETQENPLTCVARAPSSPFKVYAL
jgi:hypothetical protein